MKTIDIPIEGFEDTWDLHAVYSKVNLGKQCYQDGELYQAQILWEDARSCSNNQASFLLALLAKRQNRYKVAERLLLELRTRHISCLEGRIELELADLYHRAGMPISALGHLLLARDAGVKIDGVDKYYRAFKHADIDASSDPHGGYILGFALARTDSFHEKAIYYLSQAVQYGEGQTWRAYAALDLAETAKGYDETLSQRMFQLAEMIGHPQILKRKSPFKK